METAKSAVSKVPLAYIIAGLLFIAAVGILWLDIRLFSNMEGKAQVTLYDGPALVEPAKDRVVTVNGKPVFLYDTAVNLNRSWERDPELSKTPVGYFDFSGTVNIKAQVPGADIKTVTVRPLSLGITPKIQGDTISFKLDKPAKLTIEINDDISRPIHLFANSLEEKPIQGSSPDVIYFGPGVHKVGRIPLKSNQTIYIAGGAVVYGCVKAENLENIKIMGRGIISGSVYDRWEDTMVPIDIRNCKNASIEGITLLDPAAWTVNIFSSEDVKVNDIKIVSARSNSDGITTQSCKNLTVTDCFVRSWDDSLVVKGYDADTKGVTFDNCIVWTDLAQSCEIGYETRANVIEDITFKNITVLHNFHKSVLSIHNADNALIRNVHYQNIVLEDSQMGMGDAAGSNYLIDLMVDFSQNWSRSKERGNIREVYYDNITVLSGELPVSRIQGFDEQHTIENIFIKNLKIFGKEIKDAKSGKFYTNEYFKNLNFE